MYMDNDGVNIPSQSIRDTLNGRRSDHGSDMPAARKMLPVRQTAGVHALTTKTPS